MHYLNETDALWRIAHNIVVKRAQRTVCSGSFRRVHGRPCVHELISMIEPNGNRVLKPEDFAQHWWIRRFDATVAQQRVYEPAVIETRRRSIVDSHQRNHGANGTARDPTWSERVDRNHPAPPPRALDEAVYLLPAPSLAAQTTEVSGPSTDQPSYAESDMLYAFDFNPLARGDTQD